MYDVLARNRMNWEEFGYQTMLECGDLSPTIEICGLQLQAYEDTLVPDVSMVSSEIAQDKSRYDALHAHLYGRSIPVSDAKMLTHELREKVVLVLCLLTGAACLVGNSTTFWLMGWGLAFAFLAAVGLTALPVAVGHLAYEKLVAGNRAVQGILITFIALLGIAALYELGQGRSSVIDRATSEATASSYVDDLADKETSEPQTSVTAAKVRGTLGEAAFLITMAAELALGFLVGVFVKMRTDEDYAAWRELKNLAHALAMLNHRLEELLSLIPQAKKQCLAGIRRAQALTNRRRAPYHRILAVVLLCVVPALARAQSRPKSIDRDEGILIDTSGSISRNGSSRQLFDGYLRSTKKLLRTEPPNSRVWVSTIDSDSFGGVQILLKGWTPDEHGILSDDLNRARHALMVGFESKWSGLMPTARGTDIFGGLWRLKAAFESQSELNSQTQPTKTIWIFSDMMNETSEFPMPELLEIGAERMLQRAEANSLIVPLKGYRIHVSGASPAKLTPRLWIGIERFWRMYFARAGAALVSYSAEPEVQR